MKYGFEIIIANLPDRENLVAELWYNEAMVAEVSHECNEFQVQLYSEPNSETMYNFNFLIDSLKEAKLRLMAELPNMN